MDERPRPSGLPRDDRARIQEPLEVPSHGVEASPAWLVHPARMGRALSQTGAARARAPISATPTINTVAGLETMVERKRAASVDNARAISMHGPEAAERTPAEPDRTAGGRLEPNGGRDQSQRRRHFRRIKGRAHPTAVFLSREFVRRPVVLVEFQGDHIGLAVP